MKLGFPILTDIDKLTNFELLAILLVGVIEWVGMVAVCLAVIIFVFYLFEDVLPKKVRKLFK